MVNAVTAAAAVSERSRPSACAAPYTTTDSRSQLGTVSTNALSTARGGSARSAWRAVDQTRLRVSDWPHSRVERRNQNSAPAAAASTTAGTASTIGVSPPVVVSGSSAAAIASNAAMSSMRATTVETVASASGAPARAARAGRSTSPALTGSAWLAKSAACRIANSLPTPGRPSIPSRRARHASARSVNAAAYPATSAATSAGLRASSVMPSRSNAPSAVHTISTPLTATSTGAASHRTLRWRANDAIGAGSPTAECATWLAGPVEATFGS